MNSPPCRECSAPSLYQADYTTFGGELYYFCSAKCNALIYAKIGLPSGGRGSRSLTKEESGYVTARPSVRCGTCIFFREIAPAGLGICTIVSGDIEAAGCCNLWMDDRKQFDERGNPDFTFVSGKEAKRILGYEK